MSGKRPEMGNERTDDLMEVEQTLTDYVSSLEGSPPPGFSDWVMRSVAEEPMPRHGWLTGFGGWLAMRGPYRTLAQAAIVIAIVAAGIGSALAFTRIGDLLPGSTPSPAPSLEASPSPSVSPSPSATPTPTPAPTTAPRPSPSPEETDDEGETETPEPTRTPEATETPDS
ncbi:MAG TPA: hypothetical protein VFP83_02345 [Candidatus Limnocylindria bacterium]|nr:hypothetical protein [Candidatus Limnocylindria bacterium]